jgi:hypothetical protein
MSDSNKIFEVLGNGEYDQAELDRATLKQLATANGIKFKNIDQLPTPKLTEDQKKMARELSNYMPTQAAAIAAVVRPGNSKLMESTPGRASISKLSPEIKEKLGEAINIEYNSGGGSVEIADSVPEFSMPKLGEDKEEVEGGTEILTFADRATAKAEVSHSTDAVIFDIISNRYRTSGWRKLETEPK